MLKDIIISEKNSELISESIVAAEGKAKERKVTFDDMLSALARLEKHIGITKTAMEGTKASVDVHAQNFPNCYKGRPESTVFTIVFKGGKWRLSSVCRAYTRRAGHEFHVELSESAKDAVINKASTF